MIYIAIKLQNSHEVCTHEHAPYTGNMPCTGIRKCLYCGARFNSQEELSRARKLAKQEKRRREGYYE